MRFLFLLFFCSVGVPRRCHIQYCRLQQLSNADIVVAVHLAAVLCWFVVLSVGVVCVCAVTGWLHFGLFLSSAVCVLCALVTLVSAVLSRQELLSVGLVKSVHHRFSSVLCMSQQMHHRCAMPVKCVLSLSLLGKQTPLWLQHHPWRVLHHLLEIYATVLWQVTLQAFADVRQELLYDRPNDWLACLPKWWLNMKLSDMNERVCHYGQMNGRLVVVVGNSALRHLQSVPLTTSITPSFLYSLKLQCHICLLHLPDFLWLTIGDSSAGAQCSVISYRCLNFR